MNLTRSPRRSSPSMTRNCTITPCRYNWSRVAGREQNIKVGGREGGGEGWPASSGDHTAVSATPGFAVCTQPEDGVAWPSPTITNLVGIVVRVEDERAQRLVPRILGRRYPLHHCLQNVADADALQTRWQQGAVDGLVHLLLSTGERSRCSQPAWQAAPPAIQASACTTAAASHLPQPHAPAAPHLLGGCHDRVAAVQANHFLNLALHAIGIRS